MSKSITQLQDYPALKRLASALWQQNSSYRGAAVMVGAGFSRSFATTGDSRQVLPLWHDMAQCLAQDLDTSPSSDPLRLAEEYVAYFGREALDDLVRREVDDQSWMPGIKHRLLLELPWSDVLTTNWDTLLERAASDVHRPVYSVVHRQEELAVAKAPRIVKLHGTIGVTEHFVFTQEDYRRYPHWFAAYVNLARQVFIENELCLVGFSGDDPNFLQWAGWVRDNLATHARRIYLVGALSLTAGRRKYLESINVAPIDLSEAVAGYDSPDARHREALSLFLQELKLLKPKEAWNWSPARKTLEIQNDGEVHERYSDADYAGTTIVKQLAKLAEERETYPGWLVCPGPQRSMMWSSFDPQPGTARLAKLDIASRAKLLYELSWRYSITYEEVPPWLAQEVLSVCDPESPSGLTRAQQVEMATVLLRSCRLISRPDTASVEAAAKSILLRCQHYVPSVGNDIAYHDALIARDRFDFANLRTATEKIVTSDAVWKLRKASLLSEVGDFASGESLIAEAYRELLIASRHSPNSVFLISRLAWAAWLLHAVELTKSDKSLDELPLRFQEMHCNPWDHVQQLRDATSKELEQQRIDTSVIPLFKPGHYRDNSKVVRFSSEVPSSLLLEGVMSATGTPIRWNNVSLLGDSASRVAQLRHVDDLQRFALAIRAANSESAEILERVFSRLNIARMGQEQANHLLSRCTEAVEFWSARLASSQRKDSIFALGRLRVFIEVLARVSVRAAPQQAKEIFRLACQLAARPHMRARWLFDVLGNLLEFSLSAIPSAEQHEVVIAALEFPLASEILHEAARDWPNPVVETPGPRPLSSALDRRIGAIIDAIVPIDDRCTPPLLRLLPLIHVKWLREEELRKIGDKLWRSADHLPNTGLLISALLQFPAPDQAAAHTAVRKYLFDVSPEKVTTKYHLQDMLLAAKSSTAQLPTPEQAVLLFDELVKWREPAHRRSSFFSDANDQTASLIGRALAHCVVPSLSADAVTRDRFDRLQLFYEEVDSPAALIALPYFARVDSKVCETVEKTLSERLLKTSHGDVANAAFAVATWRELDNSPTVQRLITRLIHRLALLRDGLAGGVEAVHQLLAGKFLSDGEIKLLSETLPAIFDGVAYANPQGDSVSSSLIRAGCVRLAHDILQQLPDSDELKRILQEGREDALPEVRFALTQAS
jgi:hypothetical protein